MLAKWKLVSHSHSNVIDRNIFGNLKFTVDLRSPKTFDRMAEALPYIFKYELLERINYTPPNHLTEPSNVLD